MRRGEFRTDDPLGAALHILVTVDGLGAYANDDIDGDGDSNDESESDDLDHPALRDLALTVAEHRLGLTPGLLRAAAF